MVNALSFCNLPLHGFKQAVKPVLFGTTYGSAERNLKFAEAVTLQEARMITKTCPYQIVN